MHEPESLSFLGKQGNPEFLLLVPNHGCPPIHHEVIVLNQSKYRGKGTTGRSIPLWALFFDCLACQSSLSQASLATAFYLAFLYAATRTNIFRGRCSYMVFELTGRAGLYAQLLSFGQAAERVLDPNSSYLLFWPGP